MTPQEQKKPFEDSQDREERLKQEKKTAERIEAMVR